MVTVHFSASMGVKLGLLQEGKNRGNGMFVNRVLWKMFRPKGVEVTVRERKLHHELNNLYSLRKKTI
jgi:hypothetical protein